MKKVCGLFVAALALGIAAPCFALDVVQGAPAAEPGAKWSGLVAANAMWSDGNSREAQYGLNSKATREMPGYLFDFGASANFGKSNGNRSAQRASGFIAYTNRFSERLGWFVRQEWDHDYFASLQVRSTTSAGLSAFLMNDADQKLRGELGAAYTENHYFPGGIDEEHVSGVAALLYSWTISANANIAASVRANVSFENARNTLVKSEGSLNQKLSESFSTSFIVQHDYVGLPPAGRKHGDVRVLFALNWSF